MLAVCNNICNWIHVSQHTALKMEADSLLNRLSGSRVSFCLSDVNLLQDRLHYETLSQHLSKLGEDAGKMVHRVIDLTRPEDLDGRSCFFLCPFVSSC